MNTRIPLKNKNQTGDMMYELCYDYYSDLYRIKLLRRNQPAVSLSDLSLGKYYDFVQEIPYRQDVKPVEVVGRPARLVQLDKLDCKKKAVLMGSYAVLKKIPFRFVAVSSRPDKRAHHVFPELSINGKWVSYDATYRNYFAGMEKRYTMREIL